MSFNWSFRSICICLHCFILCSNILITSLKIKPSFRIECISGSIRYQVHTGQRSKVNIDSRSSAMIMSTSNALSISSGLPEFSRSSFSMRIWIFCRQAIFLNSSTKNKKTGILKSASLNAHVHVHLHVHWVHYTQNVLVVYIIFHMSVCWTKYWSSMVNAKAGLTDIQ